jgi:hypothetical protein
MLVKIFNEYILIPFAHAAGPKNMTELMGRINEQIINPLLLVLFALAFVQFTIGVFKFFKAKDGKGDDSLEEGKRHILWGVVGMAIMVSVFGIMGFITSNLGIGDSVDGSIKKGSGNGDVQMFLQK